MYPVLACSEFRPDMYQAFMVNGHYTKYEKHAATCIYVCDITKLHNSYEKTDKYVPHFDTKPKYILCTLSIYGG